MISMGRIHIEDRGRRIVHCLLLILLAVFFWWTAAIPVWSFSGEGKASVLDPADRRYALNILVVGNSFSVDSTEYLYEVAREAGYPVTVGNVYKGKQYLSAHWSHVENNEAAYTYRKNRYGKWKIKKEVTMADALRDERWDIVIFHQRSKASGQKKSYYPKGDTESGSYVAMLAAYARSVCQNPDVRIGWEMTWAYSKDSEVPAFYRIYGGKQSVMYKRICRATRAVIEKEEGVDLVIQTGTALQNARSSYMGDSFNRDGKHLSRGMGRYLAAMSLASACGMDLSGMRQLRIKDKMYSSLHLELLKKCVRDSEKKPYTVVKQKKKKPKLQKPEAFVILRDKFRIVAWKSVPGATEYVLRRKEKGKKKYKTIATCFAGQTYFKDFGAREKQYSYQICAKGDKFIKTVKSAWVSGEGK